MEKQKKPGKKVVEQTAELLLITERLKCEIEEHKGSGEAQDSLKICKGSSRGFGNPV